MNITILAIGSRGDVQPCVALGLGLREAGYTVRIATHDSFAELVHRHGLEFAPIEGDARTTLAGRSGQKWQRSGRSMTKNIKGIREVVTQESLRRSLDDTAAACHDTDAILYTVLSASGYHVAEMMGVPAIFLLLQPFSRTREEPSLVAPALPLGGGYNWMTHLLTERLLWQMVRVPINRWRRESLGLAPVPFKGPFDQLYEKRTPFIYGFSQAVVPRPHDWPEWHHITGYWLLDGTDDWSPPAGLVEFLANGPTPVYVGFGSMSGRTAQNLATLAVEAVTLAKQRAILLGDWARAHERDLPDHVYAVASVPHDWLFPQMAAVVHHGGAGTTAAGLRAGRPSVITPLFGDQPYWGQRVHDLGVGPQPILLKRLTTKRLADAISQAVTDQSIGQRAAAVGAKLRAEDGVARAVQVVNSYLRG